MNAKKRIIRVSLCLFIMFGLYYGSYRFYLHKFGEADQQKYAKQFSKTREVTSAKEHRISQYTDLTIEHYDRVKGFIKEEEAIMPVEYLGMNKEELLECLDDYSKSPDLKDAQNGFEKYQILSFSPKKVVLRKIFATEGTSYEFFLCEENGCVTVYYIDKKTVFEYTNILVDTLPQDIKEQIQRGKYVSDEEALYNFLENYTS